MGLQMTLLKTDNHMFTDFIDAYWCVESIGYDTQSVGFELSCYPSRESKLKNMVPIGTSSLPIGSAIKPAFDPLIYSWKGIFAISDIFPQGIPLDENEQKTAIYNFIKEYTGLPWKDVIEN